MTSHRSEFRRNEKRSVDGEADMVATIVTGGREEPGYKV